MRLTLFCASCRRHCCAENWRFDYLSNSVSNCTNVKGCTTKPFFQLQLIITEQMVTPWMETPETKKKRKKKTRLVLLQEQEAESPTLAELVAALTELEREGKFVDVQICPKCKSPKVRRVETMSGDLWGHMGLVPAKFMCPECGWRARLVLKATNKRLSVRDAEIIAEALEAEGSH
jgi:ssDNA-binding Zn-finger/Zn-ribbon topoisomerase 1